MANLSANRRMLGKLAVITVGMFAFGYALVPLYKTICEMTGINILALGEQVLSGKKATPANSQVDTSRTITVEFDANSRGPWEFKPAQRSLTVHPGEMTRSCMSFRTCRTVGCPRKPSPVTHPCRPQRTSTSWSAFVSINTPWSPERKSLGLWYS